MLNIYREKKYFILVDVDNFIYCINKYWLFCNIFDRYILYVFYVKINLVLV